MALLPHAVWGRGQWVGGGAVRAAGSLVVGQGQCRSCFARNADNSGVLTWSSVPAFIAALAPARLWTFWVLGEKSSTCKGKGHIQGARQS